MLEVLGRRSSNNVQKVMWLLDELAIPFQQQDFGGPFGKTGTADYLKFNPHGTVPTLIDGDFSLWESNTILRYLAAKFDALYYPSQLQERAAVDKWLDWQLGTLSPAFRPLYIQLVREGKLKQEVSTTAQAARKLFRKLDEVVAFQTYVASDSLSLADFAIGPMIYRWYKLGLNEIDTIHLEKLLTRLERRPHFVKNVMVLLE